MLNASADPQAKKAISAMKYQVGTAGIKVAQEAVQIHGGMGVTWDLDIAHYFKRITAIDLMFGNADHHLDRFIASPGLTRADSQQKCFRMDLHSFLQRTRRYSGS